jgi:hypothetical protein
MAKITLVQNKFWKSSDPDTIKVSENIARGGRSTDLNKYSSIFSRLLSLFPRLEFEPLVPLAGIEYAAKGFSSWGHYRAMFSVNWEKPIPCSRSATARPVVLGSFVI